MLTVRDPEYGLIGTMNDNDAKLAQQLAPHMIYKRIKSKHVIHSDRSKRFIVEINDFAAILN